MAHISVVIPVYKAEDCLNELYRRLKNSLESITEDFEIILVEDCGGDRSWNIILELAKQDSRLKGIKLSRNFGQNYAITAGLDNCNGDWVVIMDCDLQDRPEDIPLLYQKAIEGNDIVLAKRIIRQDSLFKRLCSRGFYAVLNYFADNQYDFQVGSFVLFSREVAANICLFRENLRYFGGLLNWVGFKTAGIEVEHAERFAGKSSYNFKKLCKFASEIIIASCDKPLRISIKVGFSIALLSFLYGIYIIAMALINGSPVLGWSSIIVSIYFFGGIIMFNLGVIGIYLGKTFNETKKRPLYIIQKRENL